MRHLDLRRPRILLPVVSAMMVWVGLAVATPKPAKPVLEAKDQTLSPATVGEGWSTSVDTGLPTEAVGFDWTGSADGKVEVRARQGSEWGPWTQAESGTDDGPDPGSREYRGDQTAAGPVWLGHGVHQVQVRVAGGAPHALRLHAIRSEGSVGAMKPSAVTEPAIITRAEWGADESYRTISPGCNGQPEYAPAVRFAVVHHTVSGNDYSAADASAVVRAIYYFHTHTQHWCDIGYNFLVDRFGRVYEGRAGGVTEAVVGAHAAGFNSGSTGAALIGDFTSTPVPASMLSALEGLLAWKLAISGVNPQGTVDVNGKIVAAISGHRDLNASGCPGDMAYNLLPQIRGAVAAPIAASYGMARVGVINSCGGAYVKEGLLNSGFRQLLSCGDARAIALGGSRVAVINSCGGAYVKEGALDGPFQQQLNCGDAQAVSVTPDRVGVINSCGAGYVKAGSLASPFSRQLNCGDARAVAVGGDNLTRDRLAVINSCSAGYVKEGSLASPFNEQLNCGDARVVALTANRIGVVNGCGAFYVKAGSLNSPFQLQTGCGDTRAIALAGSRVAVINGCGALYVKEGSVSGPFNRQTNCHDASAVALSGDRVGLINGCGAAYVKQGPLSGPFNLLLNCGDARAISLSSL